MSEAFMTTGKPNPKVRPEHAAGMKREDWDKVVFDNAEYFSVIELRSTPARKRTEFTYFPDAVEYAQDKTDACIYAITGSGRSAVLDRKAWLQWLERAKANNGA